MPLEARPSRLHFPAAPPLARMRTDEPPGFKVTITLLGLGPFGAGAVGSRRMPAGGSVLADPLEARGQTTLVVARDGTPVGVLAAADTLRPKVPAAPRAVRSR